MLGSRASFKLQGLAVDFDNRLWSKDARHRILTYPDLWLLVAGQALSSSSTSSLLSSRAPTSTAGQWLVVAVQAQQHFSRSAFPLLVAGARYALSLHRGDTSRANGRRQSASATLRWRSTQPVTRTCSARTVNRTQGTQRLRLCPHSLCSSSSSSRELFEECPHPKGSIGVQSC